MPPGLWLFVALIWSHVAIILGNFLEYMCSAASVSELLQVCIAQSLFFTGTDEASKITNEYLRFILMAFLSLQISTDYSVTIAG